MCCIVLVSIQALTSTQTAEPRRDGGTFQVRRYASPSRGSKGSNIMSIVVLSLHDVKSPIYSTFDVI